MPKLREGLAECGNCRRVVLRRGYDHLRSDGENHTPLIFTRTLVRGQFVPSCSPACAGALRMQRGAA